MHAFRPAAVNLKIVVVNTAAVIGSAGQVNFTITAQIIRNNSSSPVFTMVTGTDH